MTLVLKLNRGATYGTLDLMDRNDIAGTGNYRVLDTWRPRIATRLPQPVNGLIYRDVEETIPLEVTAATAALCLDAVQDLVLALEQAVIWYEEGAERDPVILEYLPNGTSLGAVVSAPVLGTPENAPNILELAQMGMYLISNGFKTLVELPLLRRGLWLGAEETPTASSTVTNPAKTSVTFTGDALFPSPVKVVFDEESTPGAGSTPQHQGFVLWADEADKIQILDSTSMGAYANLGTWTSQSETNALGGNVRRIDTSTYTIAADPKGLGGDFSSINSNARLFAVYVCIRNRSTTNYWTAKAVLVADGGSTHEGRPQQLWLANGSLPETYPVILPLGVVASYDSLSAVYVIVDSATAISTDDDIEIDYIIVLALDENTGVVAWSDEDQGDGYYGYSHNLDEFTINPRSLTHPGGDMYRDGTPIEAFAWHKGDLIIKNVGTNLTTLITGASPISADWRLESAGSVVYQFSMTATRRIGYLFVP